MDFAHQISIRRYITSILAFTFLITTTVIAQETEIPISTDNTEAQTQFQQAKHAWEMGRDEDARQHINMAIKADSNFSMAYYLKATMASNPADWRLNIDRAMELMDDITPGERLLIEIEHTYLNNDLNRRMKLSKELLESHPESVWAKMKVAEVYADEKQYNKQRDYYYQAMQQDPTYSATYKKLAESYQLNTPKDLDLAEHYMSKFVEMEPKEVYAHISLGDVYRAQNNLEKARDTYSEAINLDRDEAMAYGKRAHALSFLGNYQEARSDYNEAIKRATGSDQVLHETFVANTYIYAGDLDAAQNYLQDLISNIDEYEMSDDERKVASMNAHQSLFHVAITNNDFSVARSTLDKLNTVMTSLYNDIGTSVALRDDQANRAIREGLLALRQGYVERAMQNARENYNLMNDDPSVKSLYPYHHLMGRIQLQQNNPEDALSYLEMSDTEWVMVKYDIAMSYDAMGNSEIASKYYKEVAEWNFNNTEYALVRNNAINKFKTMALAY
jgi:tetratricopeptide (TPR) repeat protein